MKKFLLVLSLFTLLLISLENTENFKKNKVEKLQSELREKSNGSQYRRIVK